MEQCGQLALTLEGVELPKKRGPYKSHKQPPKLDPWTEIRNLYQKLAGYLTLPLFSQEETIFTQGIIKAWYMVYADEAFTYDAEICQGECFKVFEAELQGTENWYIEDRIQIHKSFISFLDNGKTIPEATLLIQAEYLSILAKYGKRNR